MLFSKLAQRISRYLPVMAVVVVAIISIWIEQGHYPAPLASQAKTLTGLQNEQNTSQPLNSWVAEGSCSFGHFYTSLPVKCRMPDGSFMPAPGTWPSPYVFKIPGAK